MYTTTSIEILRHKFSAEPNLSLSISIYNTAPQKSK